MALVLSRKRGERVFVRRNDSGDTFQPLVLGVNENRMELAFEDAEQFIFRRSGAGTREAG
jgi:hypothetical protein